ncbi:exo-beta-N-acetylmuramidase NamZ domain-containing protein, partial [Ferruginibacter sp.]
MKKIFLGSTILLLNCMAGLSQSGTIKSEIGNLKSQIIPGAERIEVYLPYLKGKSVAVFANQTSVVNGTHLVDTLISRGINIVKIFSPEHGFRGTADAGEHVTDAKDKKTGVP